jgi:MFS family permease
VRLAKGRSEARLLCHRDFRHLWAADALSQLGSRVSLLALPLLAVVTLDASTFQVSLIKTLQTVPYLLLGLQVGAWCDRLRCRPVLVIADLVRMVALGSIPLAAAFGVLTLWQFYAAVFIAGLLTVFFDVAHQTYLPRLVGPDRLIEGNTLLWTNQSVAAVAAPTFSGLLVQWIGAPVAVVVDALSYLWSALWLRTIRRREEPPPKPTTSRNMRKEISEGALVVLADPILRAIGLSSVTLAFFLNLNLPITVVFLVREVGLAPGTIGVLSSFGLLGAVVGSAVTTRLTAAVGAARLLCVASVVEGFANLLYPLVDKGWRLSFLVVASFVASVCVIIQNVVQVSFQQARCPEHLLGRVNATMRFLFWGVAPIGSITAGALATVLGFRLTLLIAGLGIVASAMWILASPVRRMRDLPARPTIAEGV